MIRARRGPHRVVSGAWLAVLLGAAACGAGGSVGRAVVGGVEVKEQEASVPLPQRPPAIIYVADFVLEAEDYREGEGPRDVLPGRLRPRPLRGGDPAAKAGHIVEAMATSVVQHLGAHSVRAERLGKAAGPLPGEGWLVQGMFTEVGEGNRIQRAVIGFGRGASTMEVQIGISDLGGPDPRAPFAVFGTVRDPNTIPGAVVTRNPYVAAAKFVLAKNASARDIETTAQQIAGEILKYEQEIRQQRAPAQGK